MINRFQRCIGIRLFRLAGWQLEVWLCPAGEVIPSHSHSHFSSRIIHLFGATEWTMGSKTKSLGILNIGWCKPVPAGVNHSAVTKTFSIFANLERWATSPTSASVDFVRA